ncbi:MAG TPA: site-specific DNA-methyltransferase [Terriglobia bacterium]|nr:site-specific DNA-methyltransferase [Terriglobia bacterium]
MKKWTTQLRHGGRIRIRGVEQVKNMILGKQRAPRNRTLTCSSDESGKFRENLLSLSKPVEVSDIENTIINQDFFEAVRYLPRAFVNLLILDPPYNLSKDYNGHLFKEKEDGEYKQWFESVLNLLKPTLKSNATVYVCSEWRTSMLIAPALEQIFRVRNRITWEREKGRGAKANWKNNTEDIWFCTVSEDFHFDVDAVKLKRRVIAPYRHSDGRPRDWEEGADGSFRLTHPSNSWTDITIPFWSMPENTDHPTQKPEKLIAKLILASSRENDLVFDPFVGSGTTAVVCKKLSRQFLGIEQNTQFCCWARKRLSKAETDKSIQGYANGVFWERNSLNDQKAEKPVIGCFEENLDLFK